MSVIHAVITTLMAGMLLPVALESSVSGAEAPSDPLAAFFRARGFHSGVISIPGLDIDIGIPSRCYYRLETAVEDIDLRLNEIRALFGLPRAGDEAGGAVGWCGAVRAEYGGVRADGYIILIRKQLNAISHLYTLGHEHGHFLWRINLSGLIYRKFDNPVSIAGQIKNDDEFADLCGWIALAHAGYHLESCVFEQFSGYELKSMRHRLRLVRDHLVFIPRPRQ